MAIKYETLYWSIFCSLSIITIVDRFTTNVWSMGIDNPSFDGPWSVKVFDICARVSGRLTIVTTNIMFLTMCKVLGNIIAENAPKWVIIDDIQETHKKIHSIVGKYFIGIPILIHVWSILLPWAFGVNLKIFSTRPNGTPFYLKETNEVNLAHNDIYRLILMSGIFMIIIPISLSRLRRHNYSFCKILHIFGGLMFAIDLLRMKSHPHSHVFNTPVVFIWLIDRFIGHYFYRVHKVSIVKKIDIDENYAVVLLKYPNTISQKCNIGDKYLYSFETAREYAHCFTTFQHFEIPEISYDRSSCSKHNIRRRDNQLVNIPLDNYQSIDSISERWDTGIILRKYRDEWTDRILNKDTLISYGSYRSIYSTILENIDKPLVLIGTGAGGGYLLDFLREIVQKDIITQSVKIIYSTRSLRLFQFMNDLFSKFGDINNVTIELYLTSNSHLISDIESGINIKRIDFDCFIKNLDKTSNIYFCGSNGIHCKLVKLCKKYHLVFKKAHIIN